MPWDSAHTHTDADIRNSPQAHVPFTILHKWLAATAMHSGKCHDVQQKGPEKSGQNAEKEAKQRESKKQRKPSGDSQSVQNVEGVVICPAVRQRALQVVVLQVQALQHLEVARRPPLLRQVPPDFCIGDAQNLEQCQICEGRRKLALGLEWVLAAIDLPAQTFARLLHDHPDLLESVTGRRA